MKIYSYIVAALAAVLLLFITAHLWTASATIISQANAASIAATPAASASGTIHLNSRAEDRGSQSSEKHGEERSGPPIDSTINVILATIGIVTLVLTLGTGWFVQQHERLDNLIADQKRELEASKKYFYARQRAVDQLVLARSELIRTFRITFSESADTALKAFEMCSYLEALQSTDENVRRKAYLKLVPFFGQKVRKDYPETLIYCRDCAKTAEDGNRKWFNPFDE